MERKGLRLPAGAWRTGGLTGFWVLLLVAVGLRFFHITTKNLWFDEAWSWYESQKTIPLLIEESAADIHPPLYHLLLRFWTMAFGQSHLALRMPSLAANVVTLVLAFFIARKVMSERIASLTLLFLAVSPHQVFYAQEARMYALVTALSLGATFFYLRLIEDWRFRRSDGVGYVLCTTLALYTHNFAWLVVGAVMLHFLVSLREHARMQQPIGSLLRRWITLHLVILLLFSPWIGPFLFQVGTRPRQGWRPPLTTVGVVLQDLLFFGKMIVGYFIFPHQVGEALRDLMRDPWSGHRLVMALRVLSLYPVAVIGSLLLLVRGTTMAPTSRVISILFWAPLGAVTGLLLVLKQGSDLGRYLMLISPYFFMLLAAGIDRVRSLPVRVVVIMVIGLAMVSGLVRHYQVRSHDSDYRPIASIIATEARAGDRIIVDPVYMGRCLRYYLRDAHPRGTLIEYPSLSPLIQNRLAVPGAERIWLALDYRSSLFRARTDQVLLPRAPWKVVRDERLPEHSPRVRLMLLERSDLSRL